MSAQPAPRPLTPTEEQTWRSLIRLMVQLPRAIDEDLSSRGGLSLTRYVVLMRLSESADHTLRMSDLADATAISPSRMTRIVQAMLTEGLLSRQADPEDRRASLARLTDVGLQRLQEAWPAHLAGVRALVMDHVDPTDLADLHRITERLLRAIERAPGSHRQAVCPSGDSSLAEQAAAEAPLPSSSNPPDVGTDERENAMNIAAWVLSGLLALVFIGAGASKLATSREKLLANPRMGWANDFTDPQVKTIAGLEVLGGIGVILPWLLDIARVLTPLAAIGLAITMVGALIAHGRRGELKEALPVNTVLLVAAVVVAVIRFSQL